MPQFWGADTLTPLQTSTHGTTLANYVINTEYATAPHDQIVWWGRYFDYGSNQGDHWNGVVEATSLRTAVQGYANPTAGNSWILPLAAPANENGMVQNGIDDGNYVGNVIKNALNSTVLLPSTNQLMVYLDIEYGESTSVAFLEGWSGGVDGTEIAGIFPLYPCVYISPLDTPNVNNVRSTGYYFQADSTDPSSNCSAGDCSSPGPSWAAVSVPSLATNVWQYSLAQYCGSGKCRPETVYADLDLTNPSVGSTYGQCENMLHIHN